jgi:phage major head subunit gpT-like protein
MQITQATLNALRVRFSNDFAKGYGIAKQWYDKVSTTVPSDGEANIYGWMAELPEMREWLGERVVANLKEHAYSLANKRYELTYGVNRDKIADDKLAIYALHFTQLGGRTKKHPDILMRDVMQNGQNALCYNGQNFFSTTHPIDPYQNLGTYSNYSASGMALTPANFEAVRATMMNYKGESGTPLGILPNLLVVPPQLEMAAKRILKSTSVPSAAGTAAETNVLEGAADYVVAEDLGGQPTTWYLLCTTRGINPFIYQLREASEFAMLVAANDPNVFNLNEYRFGSTVRDAAGYSLPFLAYKASA